MSVLFFFFLLQFALCPERSNPPPPLSGHFSFLQCATFTAVKKSTDSAQTWPAARHCPPVRPTAEVVSLKRRACSWFGSVPSLQTQQGLGQSVVAPSEIRGVHQAPGVGWLPLASSNTKKLKSPTAPSLFSRATLSLGMTTWARSLVMREIS